MNADVHITVKLSAEDSCPVGRRPGQPRPGAPPQAFQSLEEHEVAGPEVSGAVAT